MTIDKKYGETRIKDQYKPADCPRKVKDTISQYGTQPNYQANHNKADEPCNGPVEEVFPLEINNIIYDLMFHNVNIKENKVRY